MPSANGPGKVHINNDSWQAPSSAFRTNPCRLLTYKGIQPAKCGARNIFMDPLVRVLQLTVKKNKKTTNSKSGKG